MHFRYISAKIAQRRSSSWLRHWCILHYPISYQFLIL